MYRLVPYLKRLLAALRITRFDTHPAQTLVLSRLFHVITVIALKFCLACFHNNNIILNYSTEIRQIESTRRHDVDLHPIISPGNSHVLLYSSWYLIPE